MTERNTAGELKSFVRIKELENAPIQGCFDAQHLKAIHKHIFQDSPEYRPGEYRDETPGKIYVKQRALEANPRRYLVHYRPEGIGRAVDGALKEFGDPKAFRGAPAAEVAGKLAKLYGDLDHAHAFREGNSRTLRQFTKQIAREAGYHLDWGATNVTAEARDRLYVARDLAVTERSFPGLDQKRAMETNDRAEYEAWATFAGRFQDHARLASVIEASMRPERAQAFDTLPRAEAQAGHPELGGTYKRLDAIAAKAKAEGLTGPQIAAVNERAREVASKTLSTGQVPAEPQAAQRGQQLKQPAPGRNSQDR